MRNYLTEYERDAIRPQVLGKFRDLLGATAHSPAMLFYLDNWQSAAPEGASTAMQRNRDPCAGAAAGPAERRDRRAPPDMRGRQMPGDPAMPPQQRSGASTRTTRAS